jgi:lipopolysaccharide export system permease protein
VVIHRYLAKEVLQTLFAVLLVLLLIFMGRYFALYLADASVGTISSDIVLDMLFLRTLTSFNIMLPFALFIAVLLAFGRLYKDSEMTALLACGIGPGQILKVVMVIALGCSVVVALVSFFVGPWAQEKALQVQEQARTGNVFEAVSAGQFNKIGNSSQVFYVEGLSEDHSQLHNVFIQSQTPDGVLEVFSARSGYQQVDATTGARYLVLVDGYRYQGEPGSVDFKVFQYEKNAVRLDDQGVTPLRRNHWSIPSRDLWNSTSSWDQAELHWRFAMPIATVLLAILAMLLSRTSPRQGRFAKLFVAILVFVTYYNSLGVAMSWIQRGVVPSFVGLWWVHLILGVLIVVLAVRHWGGRWLWQLLLARFAEKQPQGAIRK